MDRVCKLERLADILKGMRKVLIAYSGGVDSTFLLYMAKSLLGKGNVLAVTASSESYPASEKRLAKKMAEQLSVEYAVVKTEELKNKNFKNNPIDRCYYCKKELFRKLKTIAKRRKFHYVLDGSTVDDLNDIRFGRLAAQEEGVRSPMQEARLRKDDIRALSKKFDLKNWDKPSYACLASRFAYNQKITKEGLKSVEKAEEFIKRLGFSQLRVRCHKDLARIEIAKDDIKRLLKRNTREKIVKKLRSLGFVYVTLDLLGYRTGSMNEGLQYINSNIEIRNSKQIQNSNFQNSKLMF